MPLTQLTTSPRASSQRQEDCTTSSDLMDRTVMFLQKREGIDKTLKIIRYLSRLVVATTPTHSRIHTRLEALSTSLGASRKAYRLGLFLQNINDLRKSDSKGWVYALEVIANGGEAIHLFLEQFAWLMRTGALSSRHETKLDQVSGWAELVGYVASIALLCMEIREQNEEERKLVARIDKTHKEEGVLDLRLDQELRKLRFLRAFNHILILETALDTLLALNDITTRNDPVLGHPLFISLTGLFSAAVAAYRCWDDTHFPDLACS